MSATTMSDAGLDEKPQLSFDIGSGEEDLDLKYVSVDEIRAGEASGPDSRLRKSLERLPFFTSVTLRALSEEGAESDGASYEIVAGERRIRRAKELGIREVPAVILPTGAKGYAPLIGLAENIARDSNPLREAMEVYRLREDGHSEEDLVAYGIPKQRQKKALRLALAPDRIIEGVREGDISVGAARKVGNMEAAMQRRCADHFEETGTLRHKDIDRIRKEHKRAEAESLDPQLFENAPSADELEEGTRSNESPDDGPTAETPEFSLDDSFGEVGETTDPLGTVGEAIAFALEEGFSEQAILRAVHERLEENRE